MRILLSIILAIATFGISYGQDTLQHSPFENMDFTWINGNNRQREASPLSNSYFTPSVIADVYYNYSFNNPKDNTINSSSIIGRHNEFTLNMVSLGFEANYKNAYAKIYTQFGSILSVIQETDPTPNRGRNLRASDLKFIREAYMGYHWNKWYGINFDAGIFMSFIGLESYVSQENWSYQRSMVCDFTPFYFNGIRLQIFPNSKIKIEPWLMNGWYSYGKFNQGFSTGLSVYYRPTEMIATVANFYYGTDTRPNSSITNSSDRVRFHHDNSVMLRYFHRKNANGLSKAAFCLNNHYGFEQGGYSTVDNTHLPGRADSYFVGQSFANRIWFAKNTWALTTRAGWLSNPTRYLIISPSAQGFADGGVAFKAAEWSATVDYMPSDYVTFRVEFLHRWSNVPYFAGPNGTTDPQLWEGIVVNNWKPDLRRIEDRLVVAMNFRL